MYLSLVGPVLLLNGSLQLGHFMLTFGSVGRYMDNAGIFLSMHILFFGYVLLVIFFFSKIASSCKRWMYYKFLWIHICVTLVPAVWQWCPECPLAQTWGPPAPPQGPVWSSRPCSWQPAQSLGPPAGRRCVLPALWSSSEHCFSGQTHLPTCENQEYIKLLKLIELSVVLKK